MKVKIVVETPTKTFRSSGIEMTNAEARSFVHKVIRGDTSNMTFFNDAGGYVVLPGEVLKTAVVTFYGLPEEL